MAQTKLSQDELKTFGEQLEQCRLRAGLNRTKAAAKLGVDRGLLERWENAELSSDQPLTRRGLATAMAGLAGEIADEVFVGEYGVSPLLEGGATRERDLGERVAALEGTVAELRDDVGALLARAARDEVAPQSQRGARPSGAPSQGAAGNG